MSNTVACETGGGVSSQRVLLAGMWARIREKSAKNSRKKPCSGSRKSLAWGQNQELRRERAQGGLFFCWPKRSVESLVLWCR